jgi:hypothetical protein
LITGTRITRPQSAVETLADNRQRIRGLFPATAADGGAHGAGAFPRSVTFRWLLKRRVDLAVLLGTWLLRRRSGR